VLLGNAEIPTFVRSAFSNGHQVPVIRIADSQRDRTRGVNRLVAALQTGTDLGHLVECVDTSREDRAQQRKRLAYLKRAAKAFKP
jgi:hypothetical protein